jgi:hypothetical protein
MQNPGFQVGTHRPFNQGINFPRSLANVAALLRTGSAQGQGYINDATRTIYYVPTRDQNISTLETIVPGSVEVLVLGQGSRGLVSTDRSPLHSIAFVGLQFSYATWLAPSGPLAYIDQQSGFRNLPNTSGDDDTWQPVPGALQFHTVEHIVIRNCTFKHLGSTALQIDDSSQEVEVRGCTFTDVSGGGVYFGQVNDANVTGNMRNQNFMIADNLFDGIPAEYHDCAAILGGFVINATITHNTVLNNSNTGISLGWGWSRDEATNAANNTISQNYILGGNWLLEDGGSIYTLGPQPGSVMTENFISHQQKLFGALYTDEGSAYWHIYRNVVHSVPEWLHIWTASIHDEMVDDNWTDQNYSDVHGTRCSVVNNHYLAPNLTLKMWPDEAQSIVNNAGATWIPGSKPW